MSEWKEIGTVEDIPSEAFGKYEWSGDINMVYSGEIFKPTDIIISALGEITAVDDDNTYCSIKYRPMPSPTDEYIYAHLWEVIHGSEKYVEVWPFIDTPHWVKKGAPHSTTMTREWFLTARHVLKSAIKVGIE